MSDFFADKKFQQLDWISQAVEPWEWDFIEKYRAIPDRVEVTPEMLTNNLMNSYLEVNVQPMIYHDILKLEPRELESVIELDSLFKMELLPNTTIDLQKRELNQSIAVVKSNKHSESEICQLFAANRCRSILGNIYMRDNSAALSRANEVLDLLGAKTSARGWRQKYALIHERLFEIFKTDEWRIRNMDLANKVPQWVVDFINDGKLAAMANFAKLKVMTHAGNAIYSMQEEE